MPLQGLILIAALEGFPDGLHPLFYSRPLIGVSDNIGHILSDTSNHRFTHVRSTYSRISHAAPDVPQLTAQFQCCLR